MLPTLTRRNNGREDLSSGTMNTMLSSYGEFFRHKSKKIWRFPIKVKCVVLCCLMLSIYIYGSLYYVLTENHLTKDTFLETNKCPMCYGRSMCFELFDDQYEMSGFSKIRALDYVNVKNVHFAKHKKKDTNIVVKKLGHDWEMKEVDDTICKDAASNPGCDVARRAVVSNTVQDIHKNGLQPRHLKDKSFMFLCPSRRLLEDLRNRYLETTARMDGGQLALDDRIQLLFTAMVNPEPLLLQMFPRSKGWSFPEYYGACGRYIVVENCGKPLSEFYNAPWEKRVDIAHQIMKIAEQLDNKDEDYILYWTDLDYENIAVDHSGKVTVIDLEDIIVVDRELVKLTNPKGHDVFVESRFDKCDDSKGKNCLSFSSDELCTHSLSDHNYYVACRNLLSQYADEPEVGRPGGLLHDMPYYAKDDWDLPHLLNECARPSQPKGRMKVIQKLIAAFDAMRQYDFDRSVKGGKRIL